MHRMSVAVALLVSLGASQGFGQAKKETAPAPVTVAYGKHERQVLDFWQAKSEKPTPLLLYIHGGGWEAYDKNSYSPASINLCLKNGISVAAINYRYVQQAAALKVNPPVKAPMEDSTRALQFIRSKATEWNLDKKRIGATGGSAGGCTSLWLAFHDDMADPKSDDPVARESTRLYCAAVDAPQTSLDPKELREWMPNYGYGAHAFGYPSFQAFYDGREKSLKWIKEYSPIEHVSKDDPPIFMEYNNQTVPPVVGEKQQDPTHSAVMGLKLEERLKAVGVEVILVYPGRTHPQYRTSLQFLVDRLKK